MTSLISPESSTLLWAVVIGLAGFGFWAEQNTRIGRLMTGVVVAMAMTMLLANLRLIPFSAPVYDSVFSRILPLAIPLLLFRANLRRALRTGGPTLGAFAIGSIGVLLGVALATLLVPLGGLSAIAAGLFSATYIGGSANFSAVAIATDFSQGGELTAMLAADIIATNVQTMVLIALPGIALVRRLFGGTEQSPVTLGSATRKPFVIKKLDMAGACLAVALAFGLVAVGDAVAQALNAPSTGILITSALALAVGNFMHPLVERMSGDFEIGTFLIVLFLVAIAAGADVWVLLDTGPAFLIYAGIVLIVHTLFLMLAALVARPFFHMDIRAVVIGSTACVGGVTTASAIASAKGWRDLIIPGVMAGTMGNAIGSFLGVWMWSIFR